MEQAHPCPRLGINGVGGGGGEDAHPLAIVDVLIILEHKQSSMYYLKIMDDN